jgi:hypothetical protein
MATGVIKPRISIVMLLFFNALPLMNRETPLDELVNGWPILLVAVCGIGGFGIGTPGTGAFSRLLESSRESPGGQQQRTDQDA